MGCPSRVGCWQDRGRVWTQHCACLLPTASGSLSSSPHPHADGSGCPLASASPDANPKSIPSSKPPPGRDEDEQWEKHQLENAPCHISVSRASPGAEPRFARGSIGDTTHLQAAHYRDAPEPFSALPTTSQPQSGFPDPSSHLQPRQDPEGSRRLLCSTRRALPLAAGARRAGSLFCGYRQMTEEHGLSKSPQSRQKSCGMLLCTAGRRQGLGEAQSQAPDLLRATES